MLKDMFVWLGKLDMAADANQLKEQIRFNLPQLPDITRLNIYWNRCGCGLTLKYEVDSGGWAQCDVAYFFYGKTGLGMSVAVACAISMVPCFARSRAAS